MSNKAIVASEETLKNGGNVTKAMLKAGYKPATAHNPANLTKTKAYQTLVLPKLKKHGVTIDRYIQNIGEAMKADKTVIHGKGDDAFADVVPDHQTRLAGNKQAEKLLKIDAIVGTDPNNPNGNDIDPEDLTALLNESDEVKITQVLFKRSST